MSSRFPVLFVSLLLLGLLISTPALAQSGPKYYFNRGNEAYQQEKYEEALDWYRRILEEGYESAAVYYNMGNCYYKLGRIGEAILYYEKARKLQPHDKDIQFNLELTNLKIIDRLELPPRFFLFVWWELLKHYFTIHQLSLLVLGLYLAMTLCFIGYLLWRRSLRLQRWLLSGGVVFGILTLFWAYILFLNIREEQTMPQAVVLDPAVTVQSAPEEGGTEMFILHEGIKVVIADERGDWVKIELPDGKSGWMKKSSLGII